MNPSIILLALFNMQIFLVISVPSLDQNYSSNSSAATQEDLVRVLRLPQDKREEGQWGLNNPWEGARSKALMNPPFKGLLPFIESGGCKRGWTYRIIKGEDLVNFGHELECIFFSGISPSKVPLGPLYGTVLSIFNVQQFSQIVNMVWWGKLLDEVQCPPPSRDGFLSSSRSVFIGWNNLMGQLIVPLVARIGPLQENLAPGEYYDGKINLILDYTPEFASICSNFDELKESQGMDMPDQNVYPLNQIVDALRLVGRQMDGGSIYLGKTYLRDTFELSSTVLYFYFLNYDLDVNPEFAPGQELTPLTRSFSYTIPGVGRMVI